MLAQCFYLIVFITTVITMTVSDVSLYPNGVTLFFGSQSLQLSNVKPSSVSVGMTSINSTATDLTVIFADPLQAVVVSDVVLNDAISLSDVTIQANVTGYLQVAKEVYDTCRTDTFAVSTCTMKLNAVANLPFIGSFRLDNEDVCSYATSIITDVLTPKPYVLYPAAAAGTTSLSKSTYLMKLKLVNLFAESTGMPVEAEFVAPNVLRMAVGAPVGAGLVFDSEHESDVEVFDAIAVLAKLAKKMLNVTMDPVKGNYTVIPYGASGEIRVPTLRNIIHQAIAQSAIVSMQTRIPRSAGLVYDVIINDFRCKMFNTICSLPADGGVEVVNSRFGGMGDLGTILDNTAGARVDELLTNVTTAAFKIAGSTFGDRIYLPIL